MEEPQSPHLPFPITNNAAVPTSTSTTAVQRRLEGKVAIITGGASGIGEASVKLFVECGAIVIVADVQDEVGEKLCSFLGSSALYTHCDVTKEEDVRAAVDLAVSRFGRLDVMFNNAGIGGSKMNEKTEEINMEEFERVIRVNLFGIAHGIKHAARVMVPAKRGSIICTASLASVMAGTASLAYTTSKHAIVGLVKSAASDLGKHGIRVNCLSPFAVATPMIMNTIRANTQNPNLTVEEVEAFRDRHANLRGRGLKALDIAKAAVFLASEDDAGYVSGLNLIIDGGFHVASHIYDVEELVKH
eukprot:c22437_g1_i1 orf=64-969(-)